MKRHFLLLTFFLAGLAAQAQTAKIKGQVIDEQQAGLPYATVMLLHAADSSLAKGAISDDAGHYELVGLKEGSYLLSATMVGYSRYFSEPLTLKAGEEKELPTFSMAEATQQLEEVVVRGQLPQIVQEADRMIVNVENSILATGGNALEVLEKSPGIVVDQDGNISMNGKQGIIIMIDGKRTFLSATEVSNMLRNMSSDAISKVELITNPGAKYDAEGNAGIINIRTKKNLAGGTNGSLMAGAGYGRYEKANGGLTLNHRNGQWNFFGNYNYNHNRSFNENNIERIAPYAGSRVTFDQENFRPRRSQNNSFKAGVDFFASEKTTVGVSVNANLGTTNDNPDNMTELRDEAGALQGMLDLQADGDRSYKNITYNLNWQQQLGREGEELTFNGDYTQYRGENDDVFDIDQQDNFLNIDTTYLLHNGTDSDIDIYVASLDYVLPLQEGMRLELGAKSSFVRSDNGLLLERNPETRWIRDDSLSSDFLYRENLNAAYANWSGKFGETSITAGLRAEHTWYDGNSENDNEIENISDSYLSLFPSVFLQKKLNENNTLGMSYSRRINRPSYQDLNPFFYFLDIFTFGKGNQFLQPDFTNQVQLTHTFKQRFNTSLTLSKTQGPMTDVIDQNNSGQSFQTRVNLGEQYSWNLNINAPFQPTNWWSIQNNLSVYQNIFDAEWRGQSLDTDQLSMNYNLQNSFSLPANFSAELSGFYRSPMAYGIIDIKSMYGVFAGISKNFMDNKASLKLNVNDLFNTMRFRGSIDHSDIDADIVNRWESRQVRLTFNYRFGDNDFKPVRRRRGASSEEQNRIKSGDGN